MSKAMLPGGMDSDGTLFRGGSDPDCSGPEERSPALEEPRDGSSHEPLGCASCCRCHECCGDSCGACCRCHDCDGDSCGDIWAARRLEACPPGIASSSCTSSRALGRCGGRSRGAQQSIVRVRGDWCSLLIHIGLGSALLREFPACAQANSGLRSLALAAMPNYHGSPHLRWVGLQAPVDEVVNLLGALLRDSASTQTIRHW